MQEIETVMLRTRLARALAELPFSRLFFSGRILICKGERLIEAGMG
jgi:hypothetical protein